MFKTNTSGAVSTSCIKQLGSHDEVRLHRSTASDCFVRAIQQQTTLSLSQPRRYFFSKSDCSTHAVPVACNSFQQPERLTKLRPVFSVSRVLGLLDFLVCVLTRCSGRCRAFRQSLSQKNKETEGEFDQFWSVFNHFRTFSTESFCPAGLFGKLTKAEAQKGVLILKIRKLKHRLKNIKNNLDLVSFTVQIRTVVAWLLLS